MNHVALDTSVIPLGGYCYRIDSVDLSNGAVIRTTPCPYWSRVPGRESQNDGYCAYLGRGDWEGPGMGLLWDQVKECGVNDEEPAQ